MKVAYVGREITKGGGNLLPILNSLPEDVEWKMFSSKSDLGAALLMFRRRRELANYDVIHVNTSLYGAITGRIEKPLVCSVHTIQKTECEFDPTLRNRVGILFERATINNASRFFVVSQSIADDLLRQYPQVDKNNIEILPHVAVDSDPLISFIAYDSVRESLHPCISASLWPYLMGTCSVACLRRKAVLASGRLVKRKNFGLFVECAKACPNVPFMLVGEGPESEWLRNVHLPNLYILNYLSRTDYVHLLSNSFAYVLTSKYEGYPTVVFEAMAAGCPVLANPIPALDHMVTDGKTGLFFSTPKEFAEKLRLLIDDSQIYRQITENARKYVESMPTKKDIASNFVQAYEELL